MRFKQSKMYKSYKSSNIVSGIWLSAQYIHWLLSTTSQSHTAMYSLNSLSLGILGHYQGFAIKSKAVMNPLYIYTYIYMHFSLVCYRSVKKKKFNLEQERCWEMKPFVSFHQSAFLLFADTDEKIHWILKILHKHRIRKVKIVCICWIFIRNRHKLPNSLLRCCFFLCQCIVSLNLHKKQTS